MFAMSTLDPKAKTSTGTSRSVIMECLYRSPEDDQWTNTLPERSPLHAADHPMAQRTRICLICSAERQAKAKEAWQRKNQTSCAGARLGEENRVVTPQINHFFGKLPATNAESVYMSSWSTSISGPPGAT
jgi:hypothetical protein